MGESGSDFSQNLKVLYTLETLLSEELVLAKPSLCLASQAFANPLLFTFISQLVRTVARVVESAASAIHLCSSSGLCESATHKGRGRWWR